MTASESAHQLQHPPTELPTDLNSPKSKLVYYFIKTHNGTTVTEISNHLNLKKLTTLSLIASLKANDNITKTNNEYF